jgi:[acyl-carrier-protein] S-malonyltransferase
MGRDFYDGSPGGRELFERVSDRCGTDLAAAIFAGPEAALRENRVAQPAVFLVSTLAHRELLSRGIVPAAIAGYSLGNYAALVAAGAVSLDDALTILLAVLEESARREIRGAMGAVIGVSAAEVERVCAELRGKGKPVWVGNTNAATQLVLTGTSEGVSAALETLAPRALKALPLPMSWPIHSPLMGEIPAAIAPLVARCGSVTEPRVPFYAGHAAARLRTAGEVGELLVRQVAIPSRWKDTVEAMFADGHADFLEVGPGETLTKMLRWIVREGECHVAGSLAAIEALRKGDS